MQVASKLQSSIDVCPLLPVPLQEIEADLAQSSLDEFPECSSSEYVWMLQPASQFKPTPAKRILAVVATALTFAFTIFLIDKL